MAESRTPTGMLREEHQLILRVLDVVQSLLEKGDAGEWDFDAWDDCVAFFRLFADACHHGKEEDLLFPELEARGMPRDSGPIAVMLSEHKQGRALVAQMAGALTPPAPTWSFSAPTFTRKTTFCSTWQTSWWKSRPARSCARNTTSSAHAISRGARKRSSRHWQATF